MIRNVSVTIDEADNGFLVNVSRWDTDEEKWRRTSILIFKNKNVAFNYAQKELGKELTESELKKVYKWSVQTAKKAKLIFMSLRVAWSVATAKRNV